MNTFSAGFLIGMMSIVLYHSNVVPGLLRVLQENIPATTKPTTSPTPTKNFSLLHIDLSKVEDNFEEAAHQLVDDFEKIGFAAVHGIKGSGFI